MRRVIFSLFVCVLLVVSTVPAMRAVPNRWAQKREVPPRLTSATNPPKIEIFFWGGTQFGVNADIHYDGTDEFCSVNWSFQVKGSFIGFLLKNTSGTVEIHNHESRWVSSGLFFGMGPFTVTARANTVETTSKGFIFLFLVIMPQ